METLQRSTTEASGHLKQRLSTLSTVAMAFAILNTWIALAGSIGLVLPSGGPVALLYGFILCVFCNFAVVTSLGELSAIWPTAGGQYHFVFAICTERWRKPMSFLVGWANIFGWLSVITVQGFFGAQFISAAAVIASYDSFEITPARTYGIFLAIVLSTTAVNIWGNSILGKWNNAALYWSICSAIIVIVILLAMSEKTTADFVFTEFDNQTGWPDGMAWLLGLLQSAMSLIGFDVVMHMAEEMHEPARDVPRAMLYAIAVGGVTGLFFILVALFSLNDLEALLASTTGIPVSELFLQATKSRAAGTILNLMLAACFLNGCSASITSASRLIYSMARDNGMIFASHFAHINPKLEVPVYAILICTGFNILFGLLYLGPYVAFSAYLSSCTIFLNVSYAIPIICLLVRGRGILSEHRHTNLPHQMGRWMGYASNLVAAIYVIMITVLFSFPTAIPVISENMNYVSIVFGIFALFVTVYWFIYGDTFTGPSFDILIGRPTGVIHATSTNSDRPSASGTLGEKDGKQAEVAW